MFKSVKFFFFSIDYLSIGKSIKEVSFLTLIALLPLIINIFIASISANSIKEPLITNLVPGEMLSYCLSFLAPSLYLLIKTHGSDYRLPLIHVFFGTTLLVYVLSMVLYLIAKNNWVSAINMENHKGDLYFTLAFIFLITSIVFRVYSVYHGKKASNWSDTRKMQQTDFNAAFVQSIN